MPVAVPTKAFVLHVDAGESLIGLQQVLDNAEPGKGRITLSYAALSGKVVDIVLPRRFSLSPGLKAQIEGLAGTSVGGGRLKLDVGVVTV